MSKRSYSDEQKANALLALDANGGNVLRTSRETGIPPPTLSLWRNHRRTGQAQPWVADICEGKREPLADCLEDLAYQIIRALPDKIEAANMKDAATAMGIALDKMRLLRDQPTTINREEAPTDAQRVEGLAAFYERVAEGGTRPPAGSDVIH